MRLNTTLSLLITGFIFSMMVFAGSIYYIYKIEENLFSDFDNVEQTHDIINELKRTSNLLANYETNLAVYRLTKNQDFLSSLNINRELILFETGKIKKKLIGHKVQASKVIIFISLIKQRLKLGKQELEYIKAKTKEPDSDKRNKKEKYLKTEISRTLNQLIILQQRILEKQQETVASKIKETHMTIKFVGLSAFLLSSLIVLFFYQYNKTHIRIEQDLIDLNENKNKFFSIISHDLRGPVKNIVLMSQFLTGEGQKTIDPNKIIRMIESSSTNLSSLLDNLLKWSRLQMNKIEFQPEPIDLQKITDDVLNNLMVHAAQKNISIINNVEEQTYVYVDQNMISTVIRNLISNALKFTNKEGKIEVFSKITNGQAEVTVKDNGVGMPLAIAAKIFSIDFKHTTKGTNKEEGTGLGLKLCKEFVEKNKGKIRIESVVNEGSSFIFTVPISKLPRV